MEIIKEPSELLKYIKRRKPEFKSIGFVPTMGALHQGHISLIEYSKKENDFTICSIFVNPIQFNNPQDFILYPKNQEEDFNMLENAGCDLLFMPSAESMYTEEPRIKIDFGSLELVMEGKFRPGHFNGVAIVVAKLFHIVQPDISYFGQKDLQQYLIIKQMVKDLNFPIELRSCPVVRENDGLAMSSRNQRLTPKGRLIAPKLNESLLLAAKLLQTTSVEATKAKIRDFYKNLKEIKLEYFEIADSETLMPINDVKEHKGIAICVAAYIDGVRLIDNILI
jgi:pantoate--beta-alanine ligase